MKLARTKLALILAKKTESGSYSKKTAKTIAAYLIDQGRTNELASLLRDIQEDWSEVGYVNLLAISAFPLSEKVKSDIKNQVHTLYPKLKKVIIEERLDPSVLSGVRLELANYQFDLTAKTKLEKLKHLTV